MQKKNREHTAYWVAGFVMVEHDKFIFSSAGSGGESYLIPGELVNTFDHDNCIKLARINENGNIVFIEDLTAMSDEEIADLWKRKERN